MATTTATLTLSSADLSSQALSVTATSTLYKAGTTIGLDQTTGLTKKIYATAQTNTEIIAADQFDDNQSARLYIKNVGSSSTDYFTIQVSAGNLVLGRLYGGDWMWLPYEGENGIGISSSNTSMELEYMVIYQAV